MVGRVALPAVTSRAPASLCGMSLLCTRPSPGSCCWEDSKQVGQRAGGCHFDTAGSGGAPAMNRRRLPGPAECTRLGAGAPLGLRGRRGCLAGVAERGPHAAGRAPSTTPERTPWQGRRRPAPPLWRAADLGHRAQGGHLGARGEAPQLLLLSLDSAVLFVGNLLGHSELKKESHGKSKHSGVGFPCLKKVYTNA